MTLKVLRLHQHKMNMIIKKKKDENYFPSQLLPKQVYGNSYSWAHDVWSLIADIIEPKSAHKAKQGAW